MKIQTTNAARSQIISDKLFRYINEIGEFRSKDSQASRPFKQTLMEYVSILPLNKVKVLRNGGGLIFDKKYEEWSRENPPKREEIEASWIYLLWVAMLDAEQKYGKEGFSESAKIGMKFGASLMHFVIEHPDSVIISKLDLLIGKDISKDVEKGFERVIRKRNKRKQDKRKSDTDARRKAAAIAMMWKCAPGMGQEKASEAVLSKMNKKRQHLNVEASTVRRWYNTDVKRENDERRQGAEAKRARP